MSFDLVDLGKLLGRSLSAEQAAVVTAPLEPRAVVAGAGSGKTATMVARVVWLVAQGSVRPEQMLGLTFTTKAADELASRVRKALRDLRLPSSEDPEPTVSTYHAYAGRLVRDHALRIGREPSSRLITPASSWQLAARAVRAYDGPMDAVSWTEATVVKAVLALAGEVSEHLVETQDVRTVGDWLRDHESPTLIKSGRDVLDAHAVREQLLPIVDRYAAAKLERDLLDFGDVVALAARLARECAPVRVAEREAFQVVLLDEYQDTGAAQEVLLASLYAAHPVTAVGDPCQSIYGWRGAGSGTLRRFPAAFGAPVETPLHLSTNYRSGGRVLQLANAVSEPLRVTGVPVPSLAPAPTAVDAGLVRCALLTDIDAEAEWVASQVVAEVTARSLAWSDVAVLCRKRSMFGRLRTAFEGRDVPVEVIGLGGLLAVPEVADVVATLRVLDDPTADEALLRLLTGSRWRLGPRDLVVLGRRARQLVRAQRSSDSDPVEAVVLGTEDEAGSLVDALDDLPAAGELSAAGLARLTALRDELRALRRRLDQPLPDLVADVERTLGLDIEVSARKGSPAAARADLDAFIDAAAGFAGDISRDGAGEVVLSAFLAFLAAADEEENGLDAGTASAADSVKLMTVHAAKGLEWPLVAVPGLAAGSSSSVFPARPRVSTSWVANPRLLPFPLRGDRDDLPVLLGLEKDQVAAHQEARVARDATEERRLGYVAFTRARDLLLCSGHHWGEGKKALGPSVFLLEARDACEDGAGDVDVWVEQAPDVNPIEVSGRSATWPLDEPPATPEVRAAAVRVRQLIAAPAAGDPVLTAPAAELVARWDDDLARLAAEQAARRRRRTSAVLPGHLSVTALVELRRDPAALAAALVRPLPRRPSPASRRGTAFHAWLERDVFGTPQLLDPFELPGSGDEGAPVDTQLATLQEQFRRNDWWGRNPVEIEVPFEMSLAGVLLRGRMDAVYRDADGDEVVDWKTGRVPTGAEADAAAVQLAAYRVAWHRLSGIPLERVRAAFHYVAEDVTHRPVDLLDEAGLAALVTEIPQQ